MRELLPLLLRSRRFLLGFALFGAVFLFAAAGPLLYHKNPTEISSHLFAGPCAEYPLGTDNLGQDILAQLMHGTRTSLIIGLLAGLVATGIGVGIGTLAGYRGGWVDEALMGVTNVLITIPSIVVLILLSIAVKVRSVEVMGLILGVTAWPWTARAVRAQASSLKTREHIDLARITGFSTREMIQSEILPYMFSYISMAFILQFSGGILAEATLSMLGLGPSGGVSLGIMLFWSLLWEALRSGAWWAFLPPVIFLSAISFSLLCMNAGMDEVFNPRLRGR